MRTIARAINSLMWIALGVFLTLTPIVTSINGQKTNWVAFNPPDNIENGVAYWEDALEGAHYHEWYSVSTIAQIVGVVLIIGGLIQLGVVLYEKHNESSI